VRNRIDDVQFVELLMDDLAQATPVDLKRIYATGISNGAMLCHRLAAELLDRPGAIAPVAGTIATLGRPTVPGVSVIHFHGADDQNVPYTGGVGARSLTKLDNVSVSGRQGAGLVLRPRHAKHLGQRTDVGVFPKASQTVNF
jgi:polyhydroxybutyrate depolymerase